MQKLDWIILAICIGLVLPMPGLGRACFRADRAEFAQFARNKTAAFAAIGARHDSCASGAAAVDARAAAESSRRVQLSAGRGHFRSRAPGKSAASAVDFLRHVSRHPASDLRVDVSAGAGHGAGARKTSGQSVDRRPAQRRGDVHGHHLDAAGMDAGRMGAAGRRAGAVCASDCSATG